jgi:hypothetical protein
MSSSYERTSSPTSPGTFPEISKDIPLKGVGVTETLPSDSHPTPDGNPVPPTTSLSLCKLFWHLHGLLLGTAFIALYPTGSYLLTLRRFNTHWLTQASASLLVAIGITICLTQSRRLAFFHQFLGLAIAGALVAQAVLGWRAHVIFLETKRKNKFRWVHRWVGVAIVGAGCANLINWVEMGGMAK